MISAQRPHSSTSNQKLNRDDFSKVILQEVLNLALKKSHDTTIEKWEDLTSLGVVCEVWDACFGHECTEIEYNDLSKVFQSPADEKSEVEKLLDLCSEDEALRNQVTDLEESLQNNKNMLAATDILLEERDEKFRIQEEEFTSMKKENSLLKTQIKELEILRTRIKNMESEHRLLKRDFDLVFATNKSTQKKMEAAKQENKGLRKTIIALASQMGKLERGLSLDDNFGTLEEIMNTAVNIENGSDATRQQPWIPSSQATGWEPESTDNRDWKPQQKQQNADQQPPPHMVWDPAVRALVPVVSRNQRNGKKNYHNNNNNHHRRNNNYHKNNNNNYHHNNHHHNNHNHRNSNHNNNQQNNNQYKKHNHYNKSNNRLVSPFPRRYTSSHIPRYRRKFEQMELNRIKQNKV